MSTKTFTTPTIARLTGVHPNTIKNYTKRGILNPVVLSNGTRAFGLEDVERMREITTSRKTQAGGQFGVRRPVT